MKPSPFGSSLIRKCIDLYLFTKLTEEKPYLMNRVRGAAYEKSLKIRRF